MSTVAVLFARADSVYKTIPGCEVYDMDRDARTYDGPWPVVAHPPCRGWATLRHHAKPRADERNLARLAVAQVREFGGVLEHPHRTTLWEAQRLPAVGQRDAFGGFTLVIDQHWFGHRAQKRTKLYVVGCEPTDAPATPLRLGEATHTVGLWSGRDKATCRPSILKHEYEHTPPELAAWLVELARRCKPMNAKQQLAQILDGEPKPVLKASDLGAAMFDEGVTR
jgi:hypothetical protein